MKIYWRTIRIGIVTTLESLQWLYYMTNVPTDRPTTFTILYQSNNAPFIQLIWILLDEHIEEIWRRQKLTSGIDFSAQMKLYQMTKKILRNSNEKSFVREEMTRKIGQAWKFSFLTLTVSFLAHSPFTFTVSVIPTDLGPLIIFIRNSKKIHLKRFFRSMWLRTARQQWFLTHKKHM